MSSQRPRATLADYMVVGISPTLITFLVGSLVFFLAEVFYHGNYEGRLNFILAMFVMAAVCIARISMEEGTAYASTFAVPLGIVTGFAMMRFVQITGPLSSLSTPLSFGFIALIWWSTHKLTWDCTLLDDSTDASGQGLLQSMGWDGDAAGDGTTTVEPADQPAQTEDPWWKTWLTPDKRPHTPGVWIVWFSLAALPIFGIGQWFIPGDLASRRYVFWLMVIYVGCGLGLLLNTSFLSIRKYLRQRRLEMPTEMAAAWLSVGVVMIGVLLLFCFLLPRPSPEYSVAHLPFSFTTPDRGTSQYAVGKDGQKQGPSPQGTKPGPQQGNQTPNQQSGSQQSGGNQNHSPPNPMQPMPGQSSGNQGQPMPGNQGQPGPQGSSTQNPPSQPNQSPGNQGSQPMPGQQGSPGGNSGKSDGQGGQQSGGQSGGSQGKQGESNNKQSDPQGKNQQPGEKGKSDEKQNPQQQGQNKPPSAEASKSPPPQQPQQPNQSAQANSPPQSPPPSQPPPPPPSSSLPSVSSLFGSLGELLKWIGYGIIALLIAFFAWKYRAELAEAWQKLLAELRELWAKLFGGSIAPTPATTEPVAAPPPARPLAAFADPFATGNARQMTLAQLVRYTFEAVEAWARERNCPRNDGQTPHEFAQYLGQLAPSLAGEVKQLADWYGQIAYARTNPPPQAAGVLQQLWRLLAAGA